MKVSKADREKLLKASNDWEMFHIYYDAIVQKRLRELDPEFAKDLDEIEADSGFW